MKRKLASPALEEMRDPDYDSKRPKSYYHMGQGHHIWFILKSILAVPSIHWDNPQWRNLSNDGLWLLLEKYSPSDPYCHKLSYGTDKSLFTTQCSKKRGRPIQHTDNSKEVVAKLLDTISGEKDTQGMLPICYAIKWGACLTVIEKLASMHKQCWNWRDEQTGDTLLHLAARHGRYELIDLIVNTASKLIYEPNNNGALASNVANNSTHANILFKNILTKTINNNQYIPEKPLSLSLGDLTLQPEQMTDTENNFMPLHHNGPRWQTMNKDILARTSHDHLQEKDASGNLPICYAIRWGAPVELVETMIKAFPGCLQWRDQTKHLDATTKKFIPSNRNLLHWAVLWLHEGYMIYAGDTFRKSSIQDKYVPILMKYSNYRLVEEEDFNGHTPIKLAKELDISQMTNFEKPEYTFRKAMKQPIKSLLENSELWAHTHANHVNILSQQQEGAFDLFHNLNGVSNYLSRLPEDYFKRFPDEKKSNTAAITLITEIIKQQKKNSSGELNAKYLGTLLGLFKQNATNKTHQGRIFNYCININWNTANKRLAVVGRLDVTLFSPAYLAICNNANPTVFRILTTHSESQDFRFFLGRSDNYMYGATILHTLARKKPNANTIAMISFIIAIFPDLMEFKTSPRANLYTTSSPPDGKTPLAVAIEEKNKSNQTDQQLYDEHINILSNPLLAVKEYFKTRLATASNAESLTELFATPFSSYYGQHFTSYVYDSCKDLANKTSDAANRKEDFPSKAFEGLIQRLSVQNRQDECAAGSSAELPQSSVAPTSVKTSFM